MRGRCGFRGDRIGEASPPGPPFLLQRDGPWLRRIQTTDMVASHLWTLFCGTPGHENRAIFLHVQKILVTRGKSDRFF